MSAVSLSTSNQQKLNSSSSEDDSSTPLCQQAEKTNSVAIELVSSANAQNLESSQSLLPQALCVKFQDPAGEDEYVKAFIDGTEEYKNKRGSLDHHIAIINATENNPLDGEDPIYYSDDNEYGVTDSVQAEHSIVAANANNQPVALIRNKKCQNFCYAGLAISTLVTGITLIILNFQGRL